MKTAILPKLLIIFSIVILLNACSTEMDGFTLQKSVFIEDLENPGLPIYSEWGYNTFGIYIDRVPFISTDDVLPAKIIVNSDTMNIILKGEIGNMPGTLQISFVGYQINDYPDLNTLNDSIIDMKGDKCIVTFTRYNTPQILNIIEGKFHIKRTQDLFVDKQYIKSIISGTFNFKTFFDNEPVAASSGRFDLGIGYDNFYNY